ncbi:hypothetical protein CW751_07120 [Brumimicrobium salinarum]|uniref:Uncharacterized protein n=1 Tax=Brumimicrobium salinarum TaxID=2058658 RepID=A0A2I0R2X6_9FLAO|nr:hypothetical protein [Brumimicrobium salinarum]PKR80932.1 hypothetical protein CW751_07120 [Brumimicrobium salinarum]
METKWRNITLAFFLAIYSFSVFGLNLTLPQSDESTNIESGEATHFAELSKIVFPQAIQVDGNGVNIVPLPQEGETPFVDAQIIVQILGDRLFQIDTDYLKSKHHLEIQFPAIDIIFPFHNFW